LTAGDQAPGTAVNGGLAIGGTSTPNALMTHADSGSVSSHSSQSGHLPIGVSTAARMSMSEDTGLLRVGDGSNRVRYVPAKTTTVFKRIKPPTDSDEEQQGGPNCGPSDTTPISSRPSSCSEMPAESEVVEAYRARVTAELQERQLAAATAAAIAASMDNSTGAAGNSYRRVDSDYSVDNLSQLFNVGDETVKTYVLSV
jgi:hypothetical protein